MCATAARRSGSTSTTSSRPPGSGGCSRVRVLTVLTITPSRSQGTYAQHSRVRVLTVLTVTPSRPPGSRRYSRHSRRQRDATVPRRSGPSRWVCAEYPWSTPGVPRVLRVPRSTRIASREYPVSTLVSTREYLRRAAVAQHTGDGLRDGRRAGPLSAQGYSRVPLGVLKSTS